MSLSWVLWLNIAKFGVYLRYRHCSKLFRKLRKESDFWQRCYRNSTKVWERKRKSGREKILNIGNHITEIPVVQTCWLKINCGNAIAEIGKKNLWQLWQCHCQKWEEKKMVVEIWGGIKKKMLRPQYFYNIFTTNHRWLFIISSNLNLTLRLLF